MQRGTTKFTSMGVKGTTATAVAGAATLNEFTGTVTSEALTTAAGSEYTLALTNSKIEASSIVLASVTNGTNNQGVLCLIRAGATAGGALIVVRNIHASQALNGTIKIAFLVVQQ